MIYITQCKITGKKNNINKQNFDKFILHNVRLQQHSPQALGVKVTNLYYTM